MNPAEDKELQSGVNVHGSELRRNHGRCIDDCSISAGFTLVELIVVLFIIGIAAGLVGIWVSRGSDNLELRTFSKEISAALKHARTKAVSEKKIYCFVIEESEHKYWIYSEDTDYKKVEVVINKPIPERLQMSFRLADDSDPHIAFYPRGHSSGGAIEVLHENGNSIIIDVNRITGKVDVEKRE